MIDLKSETYKVKNIYLYIKGEDMKLMLYRPICLFYSKSLMDIQQISIVSFFVIPMWSF